MKKILYTLIGFMLSTGAWAQTSLQELINNAQNGETITLSADVNLTQQVEITDKEITLDLNGMSISYVGTTTLAGGLLLVHNGAALTIDATNGGSVASGENAYAAISLTKKGDDASKPATLVVNGGTFTGHYYGIAGNGARHNTSITINNGTFVGTEGTAIYHPQSGVLTIKDGSFTGKETAIELRAGTLNISGGTFKSLASVFEEQGNGSGTTIVGAAIAVSQHTTNKDISVNITGGTFDGLKALYEKDYQDSKTDNIIINVSGGTFNGGVSSQNVEKFISGGTFKSSVLEDYCKEGFILVDDGHGNYVIEEGTYVASIGDKKYGSIEKAIAAAGKDETITLLADVIENVEIPVDKEIIIDLGGYTLNGKKSANTPTIMNLGVLTLKNGNIRRSAEGSSNYYVMENKGTLTMGEALDVEGNASSSLIRNNAAEAKLTINSGTYTQTGAFVVLKNDLGEIVVNGGTFTTALDKNVINNWDQMTINGGTFNGNILNGAYDTDNNKLAINDGTFNTKQIRTYIGNGRTTCPIEIKGGTFTDDQMKYVGTNNNESDADVQVAVSGGTFKNAVPQKYCAEGFAPAKNDDGTFTVKDYIFEIIDGTAPVFPEKANMAKKATYTRNVGVNKWGTICVPFDLQPSDDYILYSISSLSKDALMLEEITDEVSAGTPVVFYKNVNDATSVTFTSKDVEINSANTAKTITVSGIELTGTYAELLKEDNLSSVYYINGNEFHQAKASLTVPAYRAYINYTVPSGAKPVSLSLIVGDMQTTDIENIATETMAATTIFDMNGRKLSAPKKGVNIMKRADGQTVKLIIK